MCDYYLIENYADNANVLVKANDESTAIDTLMMEFGEDVVSKNLKVLDLKKALAYVLSHIKTSLRDDYHQTLYADSFEEASSGEILMIENKVI